MSAPPLKIKGRPDPPRNQLFMSFNPEDIYHWIKTKVVDSGEEDFVEIPSSYKDNPFLDPEYVKQLEALEKQDANFYRIYTLGEWGQLDTLIFTNWVNIESHIDSPDYIYGSDFGYNSPSTLVRIHFDDVEMRASVEELIYESELTNSQFLKLCKEKIPQKDWTRVPLYADSAEPDRIKEIENGGLWIVPTHKGAGSVKDGIDFLKRFQINVLNNSPNINKERKSYSWKKDKNGVVFDEPVKWNDHALDAIRGALFTHWIDVVGKSPSIKVINWGEYEHEDPKWSNWDRFFERGF
jgi:phage terminase large subunit